MLQQIEKDLQKTDEAIERVKDEEKRKEEEEKEELVSFV